MSADSIFSLVYISEGTRSFKAQDLQQILTKARETNSRVGNLRDVIVQGGQFSSSFGRRQGKGDGPF